MTILFIYLFSSLALSYAWSDTEVSKPLWNPVARVPYG